MKIRPGRSIATFAAVLLTLAVAGAASAQTYRMQGGWLQQRGSTNIPSWIVQFGDLNRTILGLDDPTIPGDAFVTVTPTAPAPIIQMPQGAFKITENTREIPLQAALSIILGAGNGGNVVQLTTTFTFSGPGTAAQLQAPGTVARLAPNFSYCPGALANPNCITNEATGTSGTLPGRVTYTAGANQFGGVMGMLITGGGSVANSLPGGALRLDIIAGAGSQEVGLAYANTSSVILTGGAIYSTFTQTANGLVGMVGAQTATGNPDTTSTRASRGTTGMVTVSEPGGATAMDAAETYTMTGSDNRTAGGRGNISLVAGGISHRLESGTTFVSVDKITMGIASGTLTPALSPTGVAAIASLMLIGGGYVLRKRL